MSTIFPREEKAEQIFDEILKNPRACERLKDTFLQRFRQQKKVRVQERTFRERSLLRLYSTLMKIKIFLHL